MAFAATDTAAAGHPALNGLTVLERGWLSSNNLLVHAQGDEAGAWLIDSGHLVHAPQTVALVQHALRGQPLAGVLITHLHTDHCGGNAALQRALAAPLALPPGLADAVSRWDDDALSYRRTGQRIEPFRHQSLLQPGEVLRAGGRDWELIAAAGHDPHAVMLFDRAQGVLLSADALWGNGFGLVFPELEGEPGFDDVAATLELIGRLPLRLVVPGHGSPFGDVQAALGRAWSRLESWRREPERHLRHGAKVLLKYHLMEEGSQPLPEVLDWALAMPLFRKAWDGLGQPGSAAQFGRQLVHELAAGGALRVEGEKVFDA